MKMQSTKMPSTTMRFMAAFALAAMLGTAGIAHATGEQAQAVVESAVNEALDVLKERKADLVADPDLLRAEIERIIVPHVDFDTVTKLAVGKFWRRADAAQRTELVTQFKDLLMNTYGGALKQYQGQRISFEPFRAGSRPDRAVVRSNFEQSGAASDVPVIYELADRNCDADCRESGPGADHRPEWKIYDIEVNNISLVTSYRNAFTNEISRGGIEGLLETLQERNAKKS